MVLAKLPGIVEGGGGVGEVEHHGNTFNNRDVEKRGGRTSKILRQGGERLAARKGPLKGGAERKVWSLPGQSKVKRQGKATCNSKMRKEKGGAYPFRLG